MSTSTEMMAAGTPAGQAKAINGAVSALTAAGTVYSDAAAIKSSVVVVTGANNAGVQLPAATPGDEFFISNQSGNTILLYPPTGGTLNGGSANASESLGSTTAAIAKATSNDDFMVILGA